MDLNPPTSAATRPWRVASVSAFTGTARDERTPNEAIPQRVLVATDMGTASAGAELAGIELAAHLGANLIFLRVIDPSRLWLPGGLFHTRVDQVRTEREWAAIKLVANARLHDVPAQYLIWEGDPGASVIEAAEAEEATSSLSGATVAVESAACRSAASPHTRSSTRDGRSSSSHRANGSTMSGRSNPPRPATESSYRGSGCIKRAVP
jgi:nucleotide-binding universal stress UspA family protein